MRFILIPLLLVFTCSIGKGHERQNRPESPACFQQEALNTDQMIRGLKTALKTGAQDAVEKLNQKNAYYKDPSVKIPFPPEAEAVKTKLESTGAKKLTDKLVKRMNRAAEKAAEKAAPIFLNAVKSMKIKDAKNILQGGDTTATHYFRKQTSRELFNAFKPDIEESLNEVGANKTWAAITERYNKIPFSDDVETDLAAYATNRALHGLFTKLKVEEQDIRKNPEKRAKEVLGKVFGPFK